MIYDILVLQILIFLMILIIYYHSFHFDGQAYGVIPKSLYFGNNLNISQDNSTSEFPQIAASGNKVYVVWEEEDEGTNGKKEIFFTSSLDGGIKFGSIKNISETNGTSEFPQIAASGNKVYVVWEEEDEGTNGKKEIFFTSSLDGGITFGSIKNLSETNGTSEFPQIAASGNKVYVVWEEEDEGTNGKKEIFFTSSLDGGITFGSIKNLSETNGTSEFPQIAASGNKVYVVWEEEDEGTNGKKEIYLRPSSDDGSSFKLIRNISRTLTGTSQFPQIAASGNNVYVVWVDDTNGNKDIYFKASPNSGQGFKGKKNLSETNGTSEFPQIAASGNKVYVVWEDDTSGNKEIYFKASQKTGKIFKNTKKI